MPEERVQGLSDTTEDLRRLVRDLCTTAECLSVILAERPKTPISADVVKEQLKQLGVDVACITALVFGEPHE